MFSSCDADVNATVTLNEIHIAHFDCFMNELTVCHVILKSGTLHLDAANSNDNKRCEEYIYTRGHPFHDISLYKYLPSSLDLSSYKCNSHSHFQNILFISACVCVCVSNFA